MARTQLKLGTLNLYNLNEPGLPIYFDTDGLSREDYDSKLAWTSRIIGNSKADVFAFQELWHGKSIENIFSIAGVKDDYTLLYPEGHSGQQIVCGGAVRKSILTGEPEWIVDFPCACILQSSGEDDQTPEIEVKISGFSRPVLHFQIQPRSEGQVIHVFVAHLKSKRPTPVFREGWYEKETHSKHRTAIGYALSSIRRNAEATALKMILTDLMKDTDTPVILLGDLNGGEHSDTLNILTGQPRYLMGLSKGGGDTSLYCSETLQKYRSESDVYYTHVYQDRRESLDHILVSQEFYDNSRRRIWAFKGLTLTNDHLNHEEVEDGKERGSSDHALVEVCFEYRPA